MPSFRPGERKNGEMNQSCSNAVKSHISHVKHSEHGEGDHPPTTFHISRRAPLNLLPKLLRMHIADDCFHVRWIPITIVPAKDWLREDRQKTNQCNEAKHLKAELIHILTAFRQIHGCACIVPAPRPPPSSLSLNNRRLLPYRRALWASPSWFSFQHSTA